MGTKSVRVEELQSLRVEDRAKFDVTLQTSHCSLRGCKNEIRSRPLNFVSNEEGCPHEGFFWACPARNRSCGEPVLRASLAREASLAGWPKIPRVLGSSRGIVVFSVGLDTTQNTPFGFSRVILFEPQRLPKTVEARKLQTQQAGTKSVPPLM